MPDKSGKNCQPCFGFALYEPRQSSEWGKHQPRLELLQSCEWAIDQDHKRCTTPTRAANRYPPPDQPPQRAADRVLEPQSKTVLAARQLELRQLIARGPNQTTTFTIFPGTTTTLRAALPPNHFWASGVANTRACTSSAPKWSGNGNMNRVLPLNETG